MHLLWWFMDAMFAVDLSKVPFNDNRLIIYPDAERWKELTASRRSASARRT